MKDVLIIVALAALISAAWAATHRDILYSDSPSYLVAAENLAEGRGFLAQASPAAPPEWRYAGGTAASRLDELPSEVEATRTPGYPAFLALMRLCGLTPGQVTFVQHVMHIVLIGAFILFARRFGAGRGVTIAAALWLIVEPWGRWAAGHIVTETLFTIVLLALIWIIADALEQRAMSHRRAAIAGLLCGVATLIRPIAIFYFVPLTLCILIFNRSRRRIVSALFLACAMALPLAWSWRNLRETGMFTLSLIIPIDKLFYRAAGAEATMMPGLFEANLERLHAIYRARAQGLIAAREKAMHRPLTSAERLAVYDDMANDVLRHHVGGALIRAATELRMLMLPTLRCNTCGTVRNRAKDLLLIAEMVALILAVLGAFALARHDVAFAVLLVLTIGYFVAIGAGGGGSWGRFRVPIEPYYALCAVAGYAEVLRRLRRSAP
jgi:hypothetical protein